LKILCFAGFKHVGKTYLGQKMAEKYDVCFIDLDKKLEDICSMPVGDVYKRLGKEKFHQMEFDILKNLDFTRPSIISLGGATLLNEASFHFLKAHTEILLLESSLENIKARILRSKNLWAALDPSEIEGSLKKLFIDRTKYYKKLGLLTFNVDDEKEITRLGTYVGKFFW
jgi:shikimate kinase